MGDGMSSTVVIMHKIYLVEKHYSFNDKFNLIRKSEYIVIICTKPPFQIIMLNGQRYRLCTIVCRPGPYLVLDTQVTVTACGPQVLIHPGKLHQFLRAQSFFTPEF